MLLGLTPHCTLIVFCNEGGYTWSKRYNDFFVLVLPIVGLNYDYDPFPFFSLDKEETQLKDE